MDHASDRVSLVTWILVAIARLVLRARCIVERHDHSQRRKPVTRTENPFLLIIQFVESVTGIIIDRIRRYTSDSPKISFACKCEFQCLNLTYKRYDRGSGEFKGPGSCSDALFTVVRFVNYMKS